MKRLLWVWAAVLAVLLGGEGRGLAGGPADNRPAGDISGNTPKCANRGGKPQGKCKCKDSAASSGENGDCACAVNCNKSIRVTVSMSWIGHGVDYEIRNPAS